MTGAGHAPPLITLDHIERAAARLDGSARRTPILTSRRLDERVGAQVLLKAENMQRTGSFKFRGAYHAIAALGEGERGRGVAAYSSGNHAQAVALAAALQGTSATILMPADAPPNKLAATRGYGAQVVTYDRYTEDRTALGEALARDQGLTLIPPFDSWDVIAGQGTAALELCTDGGPLDLLLVCVGGGGLIAGCATAAKGLHPQTRVIGVEPAAGDDFKRSLEEGRPIRIPVPRTIADGQQVESPGERPFSVAQRLVDGIVLVSDAEIVEAMVFAFETCKIVTEPSGASALAALLAGRLDVRGLRVGVTISGGNVTAARFADLVARCP